MSDAYIEIAQRLNAACPAGYQKAWIEAEVGDDWDDQTAWFEGPAGKSQPKIDALQSMEIGQSLRDLRKQMATEGQKPWSHCTFTLHQDGKFNFDVQYED